MAILEAGVKWIGKGQQSNVMRSYSFSALYSVVSFGLKAWSFYPLIHFVHAAMDVLQLEKYLIFFSFENPLHHSVILSDPDPMEIYPYAYLHLRQEENTM